MSPFVYFLFFSKKICIWKAISPINYKERDKNAFILWMTNSSWLKILSQNLSVIWKICTYQKILSKSIKMYSINSNIFAIFTNEWLVNLKAVLFFLYFIQTRNYSVLRTTKWSIYSNDNLNNCLLFCFLEILFRNNTANLSKQITFITLTSSPTH